MVQLEMWIWLISLSLLAAQAGRASIVHILTNMDARTAICVAYRKLESFFQSPRRLKIKK